MAELENTENKQEQVTEPETEKKTYTEEEMQSLIDKRVTQALATQQRKNDAKIREAEKLAKMDADERYKYELEQREAAIAQKEKELAMAENKNEASKILAEKGLSLTLVDFVVDESADVMADRIKLLDRAFKASVKAEVEKRLGSNGATRTAPADMNALTKEQFAKLSLSDKQKLYETDRELYDSLKHN